MKICGTTNLEDARLAVEAGADAVGFVFAASPRRVTPEQVREIVQQLPDTLEKVGVFVNERAERIRTIMKGTGLTSIQLSGEEPEPLLAEINSMHTTKGQKPKLYRVIHLPEKFEAGLQVGFRWPDGDAKPDALLLDCGQEGKWGGAGKKFDWESAVPLVEAMQCVLPVIVAGGLRPDNVDEAIRLLAPYGVDIASGVESSPGKKDPAKVRAFVSAARGRATGN
ncbi:MAG TPA: phosphoribosylanthranilate isomerase [Terriglobales bacterium]|nr:phosphoribosylanthranilate isomerase [Terriglobales bacterium]